MLTPAKVKAIVVDLDRTLLHTDKTLSSYSAKIFEECKRCGIRIIVATARPFRTAKQYCDRICADAVVVSNGAKIICGKQQTTCGIRKESALHVLNALAQYPDLRITLETGNCAYSNHPIEDYETILTDDLCNIVRKEGALKFLVHLDSDEILPLVQESLPEDLYYTLAHGYLMQIMNTTATKWNGIKAILDFCNCSPDKTIYFGDDQDDIDPIKHCGVGISVANGIEEVKAAADLIVESNDADGVARFIEQVLLQTP